MKPVAFLETSDWEKEYLKSFPEFLEIADLYSESLNEENVEKFTDYKVISTFISSQFTSQIIDKLPNLRLISTRSTGYDHIDINYCKERGIKVAYVPSYGSHTVAEYTFGLLLCLIRKIYDAYHRVRESGIFNVENLTGKELYSKTIGVVGTGRIGTNVIKIAKGFEMKVLAYDKYPNESLAQDLGFKYVSFEELLKNSDVITFHIPYTSETHHLLNKDNISLVKKGAYIINTSRGGIIETEALFQSLKSKEIAGAALDVLEEESLIKEDQELLSKEAIKEPEKLKNMLLNIIFIDLDNVIVSPHNAFNTEEALQNLLATSIENINNFLKGSPINLVS